MVVCMHGLIATKGREAGSPIDQLWRVAYLNSSLGTRLNQKCDGSHIHTPCSGQNTFITEGYTPKIVRIVHECFGDDVGSGHFDVPTYASAAVHTHINSNLTAAVSRLNPALAIGAQSRANLPMASWTGIFEMEAAGDYNVDPGAVMRVMEGTGTALLENARFIPDQESKVKLLETIESKNS